MAPGLVGLNSAEFNWAWSIVEAVGSVADRDVRWRGEVIVHETGFSPRPSAAVHALRSADGPVILPERLADAVREADARSKARDQVQDRSAQLVEATGYATMRPALGAIMNATKGGRDGATGSPATGSPAGRSRPSTPGLGG